MPQTSTSHHLLNSLRSRIGAVCVSLSDSASVQKTFPSNHEKFVDHQYVSNTHDELIHVVTSVLQKAAKEHGLPSISASFSIDQSHVWSGAIGLANIETVRTAKVTDVYRTGSVSKAITAFIAARLFDQGVIDLDEPINQYLGNYPSGDRITARMLGSHTAGIRHYQYSFRIWPPNEFFMNRQFNTVEESLKIFAQDDLLFEPGTGFNYSSYGYSLLSFVLEEASGKSFPQLVNAELVDWLQLTHTRLDTVTLDNHDQVQYYEAKGDKWRLARPVNLSSKLAGGGIVSNPAELVRIGLLLDDERYISRQAREILITPTAKDHDAGALTGYGLGWITNEKKNLLNGDKSVTSHSHAGSSVGADSNLIVIPDFGIAVAVQINRTPQSDGTSAESLSDKIVQLILSA